MDGVPGEDERLVRFARPIAHRMRNPLAIATGMLELLGRQLRDELDDDLRDLLRRWSEASRRYSASSPRRAEATSSTWGRTASSRVGS